MSTEHWSEAALDTVCTLITDGTHHSPPNRSLGAFKYVTAKNIRPWGLDLDDITWVTEDTHREIYARCPVEYGDVLYIKDGVTTGLAAINHLQEEFSLLSSVALLKPNRAALWPEYLKHWLNSPETFERMTSGMTGSAIRRLVLRQIRAATIPIPPLNEQKRIADKLDGLLARVDACRERLDRVPAILKRFRQAVLAAATSGELTREWREERVGVGSYQSFQFNDTDAIRGYSFPSSWEAKRLSEIAVITGGLTKDSKKQSGDFIELPYLRVANVQRGHLDLSEVKTIRVPPEMVDNLLLRAGDILFNEGGDIDKLGRGWVWHDELPACVFQNHVFRARLNDSSFIPRFFSWYGNSRGYDYFLSRGKQTTNLASINKSVLSALPIAVPPAEEQAEIVRCVETLFRGANKLETQYAGIAIAVGRLTPSLLAKAFRGELVPQDPADEPASELLARIHAERATEGGAPKLKRVARDPKKPKAKILMLTRKDVTPAHLADILKERGALTPESLWKASQLDIDDFYDQLKDEESRGLLAERPGEPESDARLLEAVA